MKLKIMAVIILVASMSITVFTACNSDKTETTTVSQTQTTKPQATDYTYNTILTKAESKTEYIHTVPPIPTEKEEKTTNPSNDKTNPLYEETTKKKTTGGIVAEESNGLNIITKTTPVSVGSSATVIIQGAPNKKYTIEFYKTETETASYKGLAEIVSDSSGFATWTFEIGNDCEQGNRKIIIKEKNSYNFIQTSITVQ